jgi:hypothetical protein
MTAAICGSEGNEDPDVAEPVIGRAFARPVGSSGLRALFNPGESDQIKDAWGWLGVVHVIIVGIGIARGPALAASFDTLCQLMRVIVAPLATPVSRSCELWRGQAASAALSMTKTGA